MTSALAISLSPRAGGNSDAAVEQFVAEYALPCSVLALRDFEVIPCTGCGGCARSGRCVFADRDQAEELFRQLENASLVMLACPVYFYHLPAHAKAWVDRAQSRYLRPEKARNIRQAVAVMLAGRPKGARLFEGMTLTLAYFFRVFGLSLTDTVELRGLDARDAFRDNPDAMGLVAELGKRCR